MFYWSPSGYKTTGTLQTSVANVEILPDSPISWTMPYRFRKFSFYNIQACTVIINNDQHLYLPAGLGLSFSASEYDIPIESLKIVENGIQYIYVGEY